MYRIREYILEHPVKAPLLFWLLIYLYAIVSAVLPIWFFCSTLVLFALIAFTWVFRSERKRKEAKRRMDNLNLEDFHQMYQEYADLIEKKIEEYNYPRENIIDTWLEEFHKYFYIACKKLDNQNKFLTDCHIAACMFFALVSTDDSINHVHFVYNCVRDLISKPKLYKIRYINYGYEVKLEVHEHLEDGDISIIEKNITPEEICKVIKEVYIPLEAEYSLIQLADFLLTLYNLS